MFVITRLGYIEFFSNYPERKNTVRYTENFVKLSFLVLIFHGTVLQLCAWELFSLASGYFRNPQRVLLFFVFLIGNGETYKGPYLMWSHSSNKVFEQVTRLSLVNPNILHSCQFVGFTHKNGKYYVTSWLRGSIGAVNTWDFDIERLDMRQLMRRFFSTVKPRSTDTRLIRKPHYYGQFAMSLGKESPCISLNSTRLIPTPCSYGHQWPPKCPF